MDQAKAKKYKLWYRIFMVVGLLGIIDVVSRSAVEQSTNLTDIGGISFGILYLFNILFGSKVAATFATLASAIFGFSIGWLVLAYFMNQKAKLLENPSEENKKKFKTAKIITWVLGAIVLALVLFGMFAVLFAAR